MKIAVFKRDKNGFSGLDFFYDPFRLGENSELFLGYIDLPIEKPNESGRKIAMDFNNSYLLGIIESIEHENQWTTVGMTNLERYERVMKFLKPKKVVVREAGMCSSTSSWNDATKSWIASYKFPANAKNIKCTYEIEEEG